MSAERWSPRGLLGLRWPSLLSLPAGLTGLAALALTLTIATLVHRDLNRDTQADFRFSCEQIQLKVAERLEGHRQVLQAAAGLHDASDQGVTRREWATFVHRLQQDRRFVGIQGVGLSVLISPKDLPDHVSRVRQEGFPAYTVRPEGPREVYSSIVYLEPFAGRNLRAFGYDMFSEPVRRAAMTTAGDTGRAAMSGKVMLVQETHEDVQAGTLMYVPVYRRGLPTATVPQRRAALVGWAYSPFRMRDLMDGILGSYGSLAGRNIRLEVFDGLQPTPDRLLFDSQPGTPTDARALAWTAPLQDIALEGRPWTLRFSSPGAAAGPLSHPQVWAVVGTGTLLSVLLVCLVALVISTRASALALLESRELLARTQTLSKVGSWEWWPASGTWTWSDEAFRLLERAPDLGPLDLFQSPGLFLEADREALHQARRALLERGTPFELEVGFATSGGDLRVLLIQGEPHHTAAGGGTCVHGFLQDLSERKRAEDERRQYHVRLLQSQKMESLGTLAGGIAHDMNNVLGAILGLATAHRQAQAEGSPLARGLETIIKACERGARAVEGLLSFAREAPAERRPVQVNRLVEEGARLLSRSIASSVRVETVLDPQPLWTLGDADSLGHALMNLYLNAVDAMPEGGLLRVETRRTAEGIEVEVRDTGCGMSPAVMEKALDPFFTTKAQGSGAGLGLSMAYRLVEAHGGQLELQSTVGQGTTVRVQLPSTEPVPEPASPRPPSGEECSRSILLVDDDELVQCSTQLLLDVLGHRITPVSSGEAALEKLEAGLVVDLVILDLNMPGLGGAGTLPRLRQLRPDLPVLLATGRADQTALELVAAHPAVSLMTKPYRLEDLQAHLERAFPA